MRFSLRARRFFRVKRWSAVGLWVCFCVPGLTPAEDGQSDQVSDLILQLQSPQSAAKANAAYKLSEIKDPRAVEPLIATLKGGAPALHGFRPISHDIVCNPVHSRLERKRPNMQSARPSGKLVAL